MTVVHDVREARSRLRHRPVRWVAALAGASLLLAGCGTVPGAAAVVDGIRISEQTVQDRTQTLIDEQAQDPTSVDPVTRENLGRYQINDVVRHQLVLAAVKAERITVTNKQIQDFITQNSGGTAPLAQQFTVPDGGLDDAVYDYLALQALVAKMPAGGVDVTDVQVTVDVVQAQDRDTAVADRARYLNDPAAMDADAAAAHAANPNLPGGKETLLTAPQDAQVGIFTAPEGEIVLYPAGSGGQYYVIRVTKRAEVPAKLTKDAVQATSGIAFESLASLLLGQYAAAKDVTVNPRFGQWDPETLSVVAPNSGL